MKKLISIVLLVLTVFSIFLLNVNAASSGSCGYNVNYNLNDEGVLLITGTGEIYGNSFKNNQDIKKVIISNGIISIGEYAFFNCINLTDVYMPESLTTIKTGAFEYSGLKDINIPDSVKYIENFAYCGCKDAKKITIGNKVERVGTEAFLDCYNLTELYWNAYYCSMETNTFGNAGYYNNGFKAVFGNTVSEVPANIFNTTSYYSLVNDVKFGNGISRIGNYAFHNCKNLKTVSFPQNLTSIGEAAFRYSGLTSVTLSDNISVVETGAFEECKDITNINLNKKLNTIGSWAFAYNTSVTNLIIPDSVSVIGEFAFAGCKSLYNIVFGNGLSILGMGVCYDIPSASTVAYFSCENRFKQIAGGPSLIEELAKNSIRIKFIPCKGNNSTYSYFGNGQHVSMTECEMCGGIFNETEDCTLNSEGVCEHCGGGLLKRDVDIKVGCKKYNTNINKLPYYEEVQKVPKGLKVTGYWYKDSDNKKCEINENDILIKDIDIYYAKCALDREVIPFVGVFNYVFYAIATFFNLIFG